MSVVKNVSDVTKEKSFIRLPIDLVGLQDLRLPVQLAPKVKASAKFSVSVSLEDKNIRGIHMSRLYLTLHEYFTKNIVNFSGLKKTLIKSIKDQGVSSQSGRIKMQSHWPVLRKALKSSFQGWREYPFYMEVNYSKKTKEFQYILGGKILYSSTCPCSAGLSREIIKKDFEKKFAKDKNFNKQKVMKYLSSPEFLSAVPHAQKSTAFFQLQLSEKAKDSFSLLKTIDEIEKALGTPVQTAVKREDEAEFARLNASNLMFCEDSVRKVALLFKDKKHIVDYAVRVQHYESLHPFTVESSIVKGRQGGWRA